MFKVLKTEGRARRGEFSCAHGGVVQTPVVMNVGTQGAIKGGVSAHDLKEVGCQSELSNTYHCTCGRATISSGRWGGSTSSWTGTAPS